MYSNFIQIYKEKSKEIKLEYRGSIQTARYYGSGPVVMLLHGFPDNAHSFDHQIGCLLEQGFACVVPTMPGYESNSLLDSKDYSMLNIIEVIEAWRVHLNLHTFHLVGHDWGAVTAYLYAAKYPSHLSSLTTLAVPPLNRLQSSILKTPKQFLYSWYIGFFQFKGVSELAYQFRDFALMKRLWANWSPSWQPSLDYLESVQDTFSQNGVVEAALLYYRCLIKDVLSRRAQPWLEKPLLVPCLIMAGEKDGCMHIDLYAKAIDQGYFPKGVTFQSFENAGHFLHQEIPESVNPVLLDWLKAHEA